MSNWGMVIDLDRCTGCEACVVACQAEKKLQNPIRRYRAADLSGDSLREDDPLRQLADGYVLKSGDMNPLLSKVEQLLRLRT